MKDYEIYMRQAIDLALKGKGKTKTNPMVGAILVKDGKIIGQGYHRYFGGPHAEEEAILSANTSLEGSSLYVSLEPCSHQGKRSACTDLIIKNKISKVIIGSKDKNPKVSGIEILERAGIEVVSGVLEDECDQINKAFFYSIQRKKPYLILKTATSLDGKIASFTGDSKWITGPKAREYGRGLRGQVDGILVGINTVLKDDPSLTTRIKGLEDPVRLVADSRLRIPLDAKIINQDSNAPTYIFTTEHCDRDKLKALKNKKNVKIFLTKADNQRVDLSCLLDICYKENLASVLVEGGGTINYSLLEKGLINKVYAFIAPLFIGGDKALTSVEGQGIEKVKDAYKFNFSQIEKIEDDILLIGEKDVYRNS